MSNKLFTSDYSIIQAPMAGGITSPELVAGVINAGMVGSIASGYLSLSDCEQFIQRVIALSSNRFILNLFIEEPRHTLQRYKKSDSIIRIEQQLDIYERDWFEVPPTIAIQDYLELVNKYQIPAISTTFGLLPQDTVKELQLNGVKVIASVTSLTEAQDALDTGVDGLIIQGCAAGGHQASFSDSYQNSLNTLELLQQIRTLGSNAVLIATGGIEVSDIHTYLNEYGADYVQLGSLFMLSELSTLNSSLREFIASKSPSDISMSSTITGKSVRGINNQLMRELDVAEYPFPIQHYASSYLRAKAKSMELFEYAGIWLGEHRSYQALRFDDLVNDIKKQFK